MSELHARLLAKARALGHEQAYIAISPGGVIVMLARPDGSGGAAQARNSAEGYLYIGRIRDQLDNPGPAVRGPAWDGPRVQRGEGA